MKGTYARPAPFEMTRREWPDTPIAHTPQWCAVDLRDGNQALPNPMSPQQKKRYFQLLTEIGFKQAEIGFPSASADDFQFARDIIEQGHVPEDVVISVLSPAREQFERRTFEALQGVPRAVFHLYLATSDLHMKYVFGKDRDQIRDMALNSVKRVREQAGQMSHSEIGLQFSPEEFTDSDLDFVVELCDRVVEEWEPTPAAPLILNLPATVERRPPNEYADMIEEFCRRHQYRDRVSVSVHAHNDMGMAVAASLLTLKAGADRVEGTLLGHGERCGNVDLMMLALNLQYMGVETGLDFSNLMDICDELVELTGMGVHPRHPYAGELVFTAFSGSHQDAIHKGLNRRDELAVEFGGWKIPYIHIAPDDIGRSFEQFIRINSQSGKGGVAHVLYNDFGVRIPRFLLAEFSGLVQDYADKIGREIDSREVWDLLLSHYKCEEGLLKLVNYWPRPDQNDPNQIQGEVHVEYNGQTHRLQDAGAGPIAAFVRALRQLPMPQFSLSEYEEDAIGRSADAEAICYVAMEDENATARFGIGIGANIDQAAVRAIVSALNQLFSDSPQQ